MNRITFSLCVFAASALCARANAHVCLLNQDSFRADPRERYELAQGSIPKAVTAMIQDSEAEGGWRRLYRAELDDSGRIRQVERWLGETVATDVFEYSGAERWPSEMSITVASSSRVITYVRRADDGRISSETVEEGGVVVERLQNTYAERTIVSTQIEPADQESVSYTFGTDGWLADETSISATGAKTERSCAWSTDGDTNAIELRVGGELRGSYRVRIAPIPHVVAEREANGNEATHEYVFDAKGNWNLRTTCTSDSSTPADCEVTRREIIY